jgi:hypothetical protein
MQQKGGPLIYTINEQLKRFENLKQKLEASPELQKQMNNNLYKLKRQNRLIHSDILKQLIDKLELLIIDQRYDKCIRL